MKSLNAISTSSASSTSIDTHRNTGTSARIEPVGRRFCTCGDYLQGVARIRCTNLGCGNDYFMPFSCKGFYLSNQRFVFTTMPKALRPFFTDDRRLFSAVSRIIFRLTGLGR